MLKRKSLTAILVIGIILSLTSCKSIVESYSYVEIEDGVAPQKVEITIPQNQGANQTTSTTVITEIKTETHTVTATPNVDSTSEEIEITENSEIPQTDYEENYSKDYKPYDAVDEYRKKYNIGCNRILGGIITVNCFYVDDDESRWSLNEINDFEENQVAPALKFLEAQAKKWNVNLELKIQRYHTDLTEYSTKYNGIVNKNLDDGGSTKDVFNQMAVNMGYESDSDMVIKQQGENLYDTDIYLMLLNKNGVSFARNITSDVVSSNYGYALAEHTIIFSRDLENSIYGTFFEGRSATIAHEILHLFGAEDYYIEEKRLALANKYYYNDIMVLNTRNMSKLEVSDITAFSVGWSREIPEVCYMEDWWAKE